MCDENYKEYDEEILDVVSRLVVSTNIVLKPVCFEVRVGISLKKLRYVVICSAN